MNKVLTITCHRVYNHGASLQQFALIHALNIKDFDVATINYQPYYLADNYSYTGIPNKKYKKNMIFKLLYIAAKFPSRYGDRKRRAAFDSFDSKYIPETPSLYRNNEELKLNPPQADILICGSDQIWNSLFENGKDPAFYLDFASNEQIKMSYAASFAIENVAEELKPFVKKQVEKLDYISVREKSGVKILNDLEIENVNHVLDPVFLLSNNEWEDLFITKNQHEKPYVLIYDFDNNPLIRKYALELKQKHDYKIIALGKKITYADEIMWSIGPKEFLNLVYHSSYVLANSFHALAFSFIFQKQILIFNRTSKINTRMHDFLSDFELDNRIVTNFDKTILEQEIDYSLIADKINSKIKNSKLFLDNLKHKTNDNLDK